MPIVNPPAVLSIAGTDPSGGAGIQADIKAISATGSYAASVITALVAQNTQSVQGIYPIPSQFVQQQIDSVCSDLTIVAFKIGMIHDLDILKVVANAITQYRPAYVVIDPVMVAKNGAPLIRANLIDALKNQLLPLATIITPNIPEAECLLNQRITDEHSMCDAAKQLGDELHTHVLLKGGHSQQHHAADVLYDHQTKHHTWFQQPRILSKNTHGTGCTLSAALASFLAQHYQLPLAIDQAKTYLTRAIDAASQFTIGQGFGPVDHFYFLENRRSNP